MRRVSMPWFMGLCLSFAACTATAEQTAAEATDSSPAPELGTNEAPAPGESATSESAPSESTPGVESDAGAAPAEPDAGAPTPVADAGADAASPPKNQIPLPTFGKLYAHTNTGDVCQFTTNGILKGTGTVLDVSLVTGTYTVACKRSSDGAIASKSATILQNQTTTVLLELPPPPPPPANGTLVAVAVDGVCAFYVNGSAKGTTSTLKIMLPPATYLVECKPTDGSPTKSRSVVLNSGETAMAMFQL